jgi:hypothetical protein
VAERDQIERALGRLLARKLLEAAVAQNLLDRTDPIGAFGMSGRRQMVEACPMRQEKRCHAGIQAPFSTGTKEG